MPIPVQCPACQHAFAVAEHYLGKRGKCPKCGLIFKAESTLDEDEVATFPEIPLTSDIPQVPIPKRLVAMGAKTPPPLAPPPPPPIVVSAGPPPLTELAAPAPPAPASEPLPMPVLITERAEFSKRTKPRSLVSLILIAFGGGTALAVATVLGLIFLGQSGEDATEDDNQLEVAVVEEPPPAPLLEVEPLIKLRDRVLLIDITTPQGKQQASCFVLDDQGHVATSWQAVALATKIEALGPIGVRIPIPGAVAIDPAHDLAILKLMPRVPLDFDSFKLSEKSPTAKMPLGGFELAATDSEVRVGRAQQVAPLGKLSTTVRSLVKRGMTPWSDDTLTISHDLPLPASSAGSPLVDDAGEVVAIHALTNEAAGSLAVSAKHLALLLANHNDEIMPWPIAADVAQVVVPEDLANAPTPAVADENAIAANDAGAKKGPPKMAMDKKEEEDGVPKLGAQPGDDEIVDNLLPFPKNDPVDNLIAKIQDQQAACAKLKWLPTDAREYAQFQLLATAITEAALLADSKEEIAPEPVKAKLGELARNALSSLPADSFPTEKAWEEINKLAVVGLKTPGEGIYALGRVTIAATEGNLLGEDVGAVLELAGTKQLIAMNVTKDAGKFTADAKVLIVGIHDPNTTVRVNENSKAAMITCKLALLVGKPK